MFFKKKLKIQKRSFDIEFHEVFLDKLAHQKEEELGISEKKFEVPLQEKSIYAVFGVFLIIALVFFIKTFQFQVIKGSEFLSLAEKNKSLISLVIPERGIIYDKNLKRLVSNSPIFELVCKKGENQLFEGYQKEIETLSQILEIKPEEILKKLENAENSNEVVIGENLTHEQTLLIQSKINELENCRLVKNIQRNYLYGATLTPILGYMGRINKNEYESLKGYLLNDYIGKDGLEKFYEKELRGVPGQLKIIRKASGLPLEEQLLVSPLPGGNLVLNLDLDLQLKIYESLEKNIKKINAKKGAAVAINPKNGAVLALVSYPSYDNNLLIKGISPEEWKKIEKEEVFFNRITNGQYPIGSTIKPFEAIAALEEKIISPEKQIYDQGFIEIKSKYNPNIVYKFRGIKPHGWVDMKKAIAVSSNIYFYTIGGGYQDQKGLGPSKIKEYLEKFGLGKKTNIDLPSEAEGFIPSPEWKKEYLNEQWWDGDTYNLAIGQSFLKVTPLQVAFAYQAIANGGILYKPQIVNKIVSSIEEPVKTLKTFESEILGKISIKPENLEIIRQGMLDCTQKSYGTAYSLSALPIKAAAKTGTAQTGKEGFYHAWIALFAPYENPEIVLVITIESVPGLQPAAIPVAYDVLNYYFSSK